MFLVSACLLGLNTKYNGGHNFCREVLAYGKEGLLIPCCPEQLGGLATPRPAVEIQGGDGRDVLTGKAKVCTRQGDDTTAAFLRGAQETLLLANTLGITAALLKARSPSCGNDMIYDGSFSGRVKTGAGVTAALLGEKGIPVFNEEQLSELKKFLG
ncbi:MAG: DUF523 domain-containing protein [Clostridiales bacterium]|jgi:uncharacterized protein YbbK (DUF523 family)|nr:DUF523 domain-containing protein [Clostridiales bacterium]